MSTLSLNQEQQGALDAICDFYLDPDRRIFVLKGYSGTGKTTLLKAFLDFLPKLIKMQKVIDPSVNKCHVHLTATTNKAAENLEYVTRVPAGTIYSLLGLQVRQDIKTGDSRIEEAGPPSHTDDDLIVIDEASFLSPKGLDQILHLCRNAKVLLVGDPAQLVDHTEQSAAAFSRGYPEVELTEVVRQDKNNPLHSLVLDLRDSVNTHALPTPQVDGQRLLHLSQAEFEDACVAEFGRQDWHYHDSKVLTWTNKCAIAYNQGIRACVKGTPLLQTGDYAINNSYFKTRGTSFRTDALVLITDIAPGRDYDRLGHWVQLNRITTAFLPSELGAKAAVLKDLRAKSQWLDVQQVESTWIDLRAAYACTINKSQGSTFKKVFIDLNDVDRCRNTNQLMRMLYVGISRASEQVILTGSVSA